jgi:hypothetical protein
MMTALEALLAGLVDYAGLFPPAALDMPSAVRAYAEFRRGPRAGALGAFVLPASRLQPFAEACAALGLADGDAWPVTVIAGDAPESDVAAALALQAASLPGVPLRVTAIEARASTTAEVESLATVVPGSLALALEVPLSAARERRQPVLAAIKAHGRMAKVRTGGVTVDAIPGTRAVAEFIWDCARMGVPF